MIKFKGFLLEARSDWNGESIGSNFNLIDKFNMHSFTCCENSCRYKAYHLD